MAKTFNIKNVDWTKQPMFFGEEPNTQRYDQQKYPLFEKLNHHYLILKIMICCSKRQNCPLKHKRASLLLI